MRLRCWCCAALLMVASDAHAQSGAAKASVVERIRQAGVLKCGIDQSEAEYSMTEEHGSRVAFDHDLCKAVAVAVAGAAAGVEVKGYPDEDTALAALRGGEVDLVASVSDDFSHVSKEVEFSPPVLYDGAAFLVARGRGVTRAADLSGKKICFLAETEVELAVRGWFERRHLNFVPFPFQEEGEMEAAFVTNNCAAMASDLTRLGNSRAAFGKAAKDYAILPEVISSDTMAMAARAGDRELGDIVKWTIEVLLQAEESGATAKSVAEKDGGDDPMVRKLSGKTKELGRPLGLDDAWAARVIEAVGNYGEMFRRDIGQDSPMQLPRGENALAKDGGLMRALPLK